MEIWKLDFFVHTDGFANGGYKNTHYFTSKRQAMDYIKSYPFISLVKLEQVSLQQFEEDYMGGY